MSTPVTPPSLRVDVEGISSCVNEVLEFFERTTCYDFLPESSQVVVVDVDLPMRRAFEVAVENHVTFATLWDSKTGKPCGMLTVTDYVKIVLNFVEDKNKMEQFWDEPIRRWRNQRAQDSGRKEDALISVGAEDSLLDALQLLYNNQIHRIPVTDPTGGLLYVISHCPLLGFLVSNSPLESDLFSRSVADLRLGTFEELSTNSPEATIGELLRQCMDKSVSSIPIVGEDGRLLEVFSRDDVMQIASGADYNLTMKFSEAITVGSRPHTTEHTCRKTDSLKDLLGLLAQTGKDRLLVTSEDDMLEGVISTGDIFKFFYANAKGPMSPRFSPRGNRSFESVNSAGSD